MLLSYLELQDLILDGVIDAVPENVNGASIDIRLGSTMLVELEPHYEELNVIDLQRKESPKMVKVDMKSEYQLRPGQFVLATSMETFNLPSTIACKFLLKSSIARAGLNSLLAGWCDPNWTNSKLTITLKNDTQFHTLILRPGMKIGQMVFYRINPVPFEHSYAVKGRYNHSAIAVESKGL